ALFNFLFARHHRGDFLLRIEDTDKERSTPEATEAILDGLRWLGMSWDEGPLFQSQRYDLYRSKLDALLQKGKAYRCYCTPAELEERRKAQLAAKQPPKYDGRCRLLIGKHLEKPSAIRFLVPQGGTTVHDVVKGDTSFNNRELEDLVLARTDGSPTYNFVVVVDDVDMRITHVIRGDDHLNNTPKQILLYAALGSSPPAFAHVPMILGQDKQRLSKRHGATSVQSYREMGYLPHALVNFLARLGWSHGDQEIFSLEELIESFDLDSVGKSAGVFNERKLLWLNQHYIKNEKAELLLAGLGRFIQIPEERKSGEGWKKTIDLLRERSKTVQEMAELARFYFLDEPKYDDKAVAKFLTPAIKDPFEKLRDLFQACEPFDEATLRPKFEALITELGMNLAQLAQPLRVALVGGTVSPGIFEVLELLGKKRVLSRLEAVLARL
ncbi:MAG TPA: glutamate--tRNA ligase, partial [Bdellovibrionota bacterium]|nr:glutamate--tRNA ligase [Bdellovibrionota bacterium]